jgi:hypothetical protein
VFESSGKAVGCVVVCCAEKGGTDRSPTVDDSCSQYGGGRGAAT